MNKFKQQITMAQTRESSMRELYGEPDKVESFELTFGDFEDKDGRRFTATCKGEYNQTTNQVVYLEITDEEGYDITPQFWDEETEYLIRKELK